MKNIGALWIKKGAKGTYMSGVLNDLRGDIQIAVFKNDRKEKDTHPDYRIVVMIDDDKPRSSKPSEEEVNTEELPF